MQTNPLLSIRDALQTDRLTPDDITRAAQHPHEFMRRLQAEWGPQLLPPDWLGEGHLSTRPDDIIVHCSSRLRVHDTAEWLLDQITTALLLGQRVLIPPIGRELAMPLPPAPEWVEPFLHFYAVLEPLFDADLLGVYVDSPGPALFRDFPAGSECLAQLRNSGLTHDLTDVARISNEWDSVSGLGADDWKAYHTAQAALRHMSVINDLGGGIPWPCLRSTHCVPALMGASVDLQRKLARDAWRMGVLASVEVPNLRDLDAASIVSLRADSAYRQWQDELRRALDLADYSLGRGATLAEASTELADRLRQAASPLTQEVNASRFLRALRAGASFFSLSAVQLLTASSIAGAVDVPDSAGLLTATAVAAAGEALTGHWTRKRGDPPLRHYQAFIGTHPVALPDISPTAVGDPWWLELDDRDSLAERASSSQWHAYESHKMQEGRG